MDNQLPSTMVPPEYDEELNHLVTNYYLLFYLSFIIHYYLSLLFIIIIYYLSFC
ncbi:unnamed protein product [Brugia timori]|uniref:Uncharacterized protein n=1 Tax=Brugia timori TaxID=42155 RepID=A0A0R3Q607_9BILA|nr:unnamed protein product [Brugia timori]